jgi:hypothetical protein
MTSAVTLAQSASAGVTLGFKNRMINSDFTVWQRGTSLTFTSGAYTADMWIIEPRSSQSCTISQSTDVPSGQGFGYSGRFTATSGALQGFHIRTAIENPAAGNYGEFQPGTTWTFSLWAKSAFAGVAITPIFFLSSNAISNPNASVGLNGGGQTIASTWTRYTWTVTMPTWTADSGSLSLCNQLTIRLLVGAGSQDLYITGAQMEPGTIATSFDRRPLQVETDLSRRYFARVTAPGQEFYPCMLVGGFTFPSNWYKWITAKLPVTMRTAPSVTFYPNPGSTANPGQARYFTGNQSGAGNNYNIYGSETSIDYVKFAVYNEHNAITCYGAGAWYDASAEL